MGFQKGSPFPGDFLLDHVKLQGCNEFWCCGLSLQAAPCIQIRKSNMWHAWPQTMPSQQKVLFWFSIQVYHYILGTSHCDRRTPALLLRSVNGDGHGAWILCGHGVLQGRRGSKGPFPEARNEGAKRPDNMRLQFRALGQWATCPHGPEQSVFLPSSPTPCEELAEWRTVTWLFIRSHSRPCCMWKHRVRLGAHVASTKVWSHSRLLLVLYCLFWIFDRSQNEKKGLWCFISMKRNVTGVHDSLLPSFSCPCQGPLTSREAISASLQWLIHKYLKVHEFCHRFHWRPLKLPRVDLAGRTQIVGELGAAFYRFKQLRLEEAACRPGAMQIALFHPIWFCSRASSLNAKVLKAQGRVRCYLLPQSCPLCILELNRIMPTDYMSL